jgi:hypothetical protein
MPLDDVAEAIGATRGDVVHMLGRELPRVEVKGRVYVPTPAVAAYVHGLEWIPAGFNGPSPAYEWMLGDALVIAKGAWQASDLELTMKGASDEALEAVLEKMPDLVRRIRKTPAGH